MAWGFAHDFQLEKADMVRECHVWTKGSYLPELARGVCLHIVANMTFVSLEEAATHYGKQTLKIMYDM